MCKKKEERIENKDYPQVSRKMRPGCCKEGCLGRLSLTVSSSSTSFLDHAIVFRTLRLWVVSGGWVMNW